MHAKLMGDLQACLQTYGQACMQSDFLAVRAPALPSRKAQGGLKATSLSQARRFPAGVGIGCSLAARSAGGEAQLGFQLGRLDESGEAMQFALADVRQMEPQGLD